MLVMAGKAAAHCGSGCTLGDIIAESLVLAVPGLAGWFGWPWLFGDKIFAVWVLDFILARSEEHTSELQSLMRISYAVFCLKKKNPINTQQTHIMLVSEQQNN